jgi:SAM-dependent methyltransferase
MENTPNDAASYWEQRLAQHWGLEGVGYLGLGDGYNQALYRVKGAVFRRTVSALNLDLASARVLDIGSGTGFVIDQWLALGVTAIVGTDITPFAANQLQRKYAGLEIRQLDIGSELPDDLQPGSFDCVSALDVLYHIVDDEAYRRALQNVGRLLRPGGHFFLSDNFLHGPTQRGEHQVSHALETLEGWLADAGLPLQSRCPQYVLLNYPVDSTNPWLHRWWGFLAGHVCRRPHSVGWVKLFLVPLETALTRFIHEGPTTKLAVCRKVTHQR